MVINLIFRLITHSIRIQIISTIYFDLEFMSCFLLLKMTFFGLINSTSNWNLDEYLFLFRRIRAVINHYVHVEFLPQSNCSLGFQSGFYKNET